MKLGLNLLAALGSSTWTVLIGLLVVPIYVRFLGIEAYGLIGFFATTQALLTLLSMGMAPTASREVARHSASGTMQEARSLLHSLGVVYWWTAALIAGLIVALATTITTYWIHSEQLAPSTVAQAVALMGLVIACRWPIGLYEGVLVGAHRLAVSSCINIVMATVASVGAVAVLAFMSPTIGAFFMWQALAGLAHALLMKWWAWKVVGGGGAERFNLSELKAVWRFSAGMSGIALTAVIFTQLDKLILSKTLTLPEFGRYTLATVVAGALYVFIMPAYSALYPRFCTLVALGDSTHLLELYRGGTRALSSVLFPLAMVLFVASDSIVFLWTGNADIAAVVAPVIGILAVGTALHGVMFFPYALQIAHGNVRLPLTINITMMVVLVPLTVFLSLRYGAIGGALAWLALHALYVLLGTWLTHRQLLKGVGVRWLLQDVGVPLGISILAGALGLFASHSITGPALLLASATVLAMFAFVACIFTMPRWLRAVILEKLGLRLSAPKLTGLPVTHNDR
jgi:O-antigen/teichoic acid export membrane protein